MNKWRLAFVPLLCAMLWACAGGGVTPTAESVPRPGPVSSVPRPGSGAQSQRPIHIVILGSSTACGKNLNVAKYGGQSGGLAGTWPNRYADYLAKTRPGSKITNLCKPGYATYQAMPSGTHNPRGTSPPDPSRNITAALARKPDAVILAYPRIPVSANPKQIIANIDAIRAAAGSIPVWVQTPQPTWSMGAGELSARLKFRQMLLDHYGKFVLDFWTPLAGGDGRSMHPRLGLGDGGHPNKAGHQALFEAVVSAGIPERVFRAGN